METVIEKGPGFGLDREAVGYVYDFLKCVRQP